MRYVGILLVFLLLPIGMSTATIVNQTNLDNVKDMTSSQNMLNSKLSQISEISENSENSENLRNKSSFKIGSEMIDANEGFNNSIIDNFPVLADRIQINYTSWNYLKFHWVRIDMVAEMSYTLNITGYAETLTEPRLFDESWNAISPTKVMKEITYIELYLGNLTGTYFLGLRPYIDQNLTLDLYNYNGQHPELDAINTTSIDALPLGTYNNYPIETTYLEFTFPSINNWYLEINGLVDSASYRAFQSDGTLITTITREATSGTFRTIFIFQNISGEVIIETSSQLGKVISFKIGDQSILTRKVAVNYHIPNDIPLNEQISYSERVFSCQNDCGTKIRVENQYAYTLRQDIPDFSDFTLLIDYWKGTIVDTGYYTNIRPLLPIYTLWSDGSSSLYNSAFLNSDPIYETSFLNQQDNIYFSMNFMETQFSSLNELGIIEQVTAYTGNIYREILQQGQIPRDFSNIVGLYYNIDDKITTYTSNILTGSLNIGFSRAIETVTIDSTSDISSTNFYDIRYKNELFAKIDLYFNDDLIVNNNDRSRLFPYLIMPTTLEIGENTIQIHDLLIQNNEVIIPKNPQFPNHFGEVSTQQWYEYQGKNAETYREYTFDTDTGLLNSLYVQVDGEMTMEMEKDPDPVITTTSNISPIESTPTSSEDTHPISSEDAFLNFQTLIIVTIASILSYSKLLRREKRR